jgi:hypothetical protein
MKRFSKLIEYSSYDESSRDSNKEVNTILEKILPILEMVFGRSVEFVKKLYDIYIDWTGLYQQFERKPNQPLFSVESYLKHIVVTGINDGKQGILLIIEFYYIEEDLYYLSCINEYILELKKLGFSETEDVQKDGKIQINEPEEIQ